MTISILGGGEIVTEETSLKLSGSSIIIPKGNTADRPSVPVTGMIRFNEETRVFELYSGNSWLNVTQPANVTLNLLVVAGGGGGGPSQVSDMPRQAGGGGGGAIVGNISLGVITSISVFSIGAGGLNGAPSLSASTRGSNTVITLVGKNNSIRMTSFGGGIGGAVAGPAGQFNPDSDGGCGGGRGGYSPPASNNGVEGFGGNAITGPSAIGSGVQGFSGGASIQAPGALGAGGGGAGQRGGNASVGGWGGNGYLWLNGKYYSGGGGRTGAIGGLGGGGYGNGTSATAFTGGGGGAGSPGPGGVGAGGSGIILLSHSNIISNAVISEGLTVTVNTTVIPGSFVYEITAGTGSLSWV